MIIIYFDCLSLLVEDQKYNLIEVTRLMQICFLLYLGKMISLLILNDININSLNKGSRITC